MLTNFHSRQPRENVDKFLVGGRHGKFCFKEKTGCMDLLKAVWKKTRFGYVRLKMSKNWESEPLNPEWTGSDAVLDKKKIRSETGLDQNGTRSNSDQNRIRTDPDQKIRLYSD